MAPKGFQSLARHSTSKSGLTIPSPGLVEANQWGPYVRDPSGIWILPAGEKAVLPLSGVAFGAAPAAGDPSRQDWASGFSNGLAALEPKIDYLSQKAEALGVGVGTLSTVWTEATEMEPGFMPAFDIAMKVADVIIGLANQVLGVSSQITDVTGAVSKAVGSAAGVIPLLGTIIDAIVGIFSFFDTEAEDRAAAKEAKRIALARVKNQCMSWTQQGKPVGTGPAGTSSPTPADMFAKIAQGGPGQKLPYNIGGVWVLMCGDQAEGYCDYYAGTDLHKVVWIPAAERRLLWQVIKGVMAARAPTGFHHGVDNPLTTDFGRALMPYAQELARRWGPKQGGGRNWWNHSFTRRAGMLLGGVECASGSAGGQTVKVCRGCDDGGVREWRTVPVEPGFVKYDTSVGVQFTRSIISWQNKLAYEINPKWKAAAEQINREAQERMRANLTAAGTRKLLVNAASAEEAFAKSQRDEAERKELRDKILHGLAGVSGSAAAAYLAWTGMRKFGPKKRGR
jgi:hypothetical protein